MPYILPEDLIPWLSDRNIWADVPTRKIKRYWQHLKDVGSDLATASPQCDHHPLWIWGDAAHYNKEQNIIVICFGSVLDDNTDSIKQRFPLVLCREDLWMQLEWIVLLVLYLFYLKTCSIYIFIFASTYAGTCYTEELSCGYSTLYSYLEPAPCPQCLCEDFLNLRFLKSLLLRRRFWSVVVVTSTCGIKQRNAVQVHHLTRAKIVKSLEKIYHGGICFNDGTQQRFCLTEIRGDWKFQKETIWVDFFGEFQNPTS